ncbi:hypothetical protein, partial [Pseudomonas sp. GM78]|uniref:hypothetical protein n=1 Tax=Pseudomonas sp. GM78 TaxID=1144337 RepID=UPI001EE678B3
GYLGLFQVTRRKGETLGGRYRRNGYVHRKNGFAYQAAFAGKSDRRTARSYSKSSTSASDWSTVRPP